MEDALATVKITTDNAISVATATATDTSTAAADSVTIAEFKHGKRPSASEKEARQSECTLTAPIATLREAGTTSNSHPPAWLP